MNPYIVYDDGKHWASYEDIYSINQKMIFIKANQLAGAFLWSIDLDDFTGKYCNQGIFPLLNAIKLELGSKNKNSNEKKNRNDENSSSNLKYSCTFIVLLLLLHLLNFDLN
jgi:GH18 family chitinase